MRRWTEAEVEYISDNCGFITNKDLAVQLGRTHKSIKAKLGKLGISVYSNFYTARLLGHELNRNHKTVMKWYYKGLLNGELSKLERGLLNNAMIFKEKDIVSFLNNHYSKFEYDYRKIPNLYFRNIVKGKLNDSCKELSNTRR